MTDKATTLPDFNPNRDPRVSTIKGKTEELIKYIRHLKSGPGGDPPVDARCADKAIDAYELAAMWAVKSLYVK